MMLPSLLLLHALAAPASLLTNGDFAKGMHGWGTSNDWYAVPKGGGTSPVTITADGPEGRPALRLEGKGLRGIALQSVVAFPGRYRVTGWVRTEDLTPGTAKVLLEWFDPKGTWMSGTTAVEVGGTTPWKRFETTVEAPANTRGLHFDLLTTDPTQGNAWFAGLTLERVPSSTTPPPAPKLVVTSPEGRSGELQVAWPAQAADVVRMVVYASPDGPPSADTIPAAMVDPQAGSAHLYGLTNVQPVSVTAVAVNADGLSSARAAVVTATPVDRQVPRPGTAFAERLADGRVRLAWSPHPLDDHLRLLEARVAGGASTRIELGPLTAASRPVFATFLVDQPLTAPAAATALEVRCQLDNGRQSEPLSVPIAPAAPAAAGPWALATAAPNTQVPRDAATLPAGPPLELLVQPGTADGRQLLLRPTAPLRHVRVRFGPLRNGAQSIPGSHLAWHFVNYVHLDLNSRATPPEELVWKGPADYPDELSDDVVRDLPANQVQPIYLRVSVPEGCAAGTYQGEVTLASDEGSQTLPLTVRVVGPAAPRPEQRRLTFVYWYSWDQPCKQLGVEQSSEDGWRVLRRLGEMMREYHQNSVVVPLGMANPWVKADGTLVYDWRDFDRYVETFRSVGVDRLFCLSHVGGRTTDAWESPTFSAHTVDARRMDSGERVPIPTLDVLPAIQAHLEQKGWLDRFAAHVADEPIPVNEASWKALSDQVHERAPKLRRIDAIHVPDLHGHLEIQVPQLNYFKQWLDQYQQAQAAGDQVWFYDAWVPQGEFPNRMIDSSAIKPRVLHWLNALYDTAGYLHWALNHWQISLNSLQSPGDQYIVWPSKRYVANSSLRYEAEREGMAEAELMLDLRAALVKGGKTPAAAAEQVWAMVRPAVQDITHYTRAWDELEAARRRLLSARDAAR